MRYIFICTVFIFLAACSSFQLSTETPLDQSQDQALNQVTANKEKPVQQENIELTAPLEKPNKSPKTQAILPLHNLNSNDKNIDANITVKKLTAPHIDNFVSLLPKTNINETKLHKKDTHDINSLVDQFFKFDTQPSLNIETSDFSEYGFITPSNDLEIRVNNELRELRSAEIPATNTPDILKRVRAHFKLDLDLDNRRIKNQLNWYLRNPNYLDRVFKRSARYMHYVVEEVIKRDLPMELALLPFVESAYDPFAYSHGRASGLWQFIPGTGKIYGLHQNWWYDGRRDVPASTKAALDYLSYLNKRFNGNWLHALAAYNSGSGRVSKAIKRNNKKSKNIDFWSLKLPKETKAYVPKLLALAKIVQNPAAYGITLPTIPDKAYFKIVKTGAQIDLAQAASLADININEIYKLNPGFNQWASSPLGPHRLLVPVENAHTFELKLKNMPPSKRLNWNRYSVRRGDSLIRIAKKFNTTPKLIKQVNHLKSNMIREKQKLLIPVASKGKSYYDLSQQNRLTSKQSKLKGSKGSTKLYYTVKAGDTMWDLSLAHKVGVRSLAKWNGMAPTDVLRPGKKLLIWSKAKQNTIMATASELNRPFAQKRQMIKRIGYRVRKGDSLARIASKFSVSIKNLIVWNKLNKKKYLQPGQKLTIYVDLTNS